MWLDLQKPALMAQELKSNLQHYINDIYTHALSRNIKWVAIHSQVCFHRWLFSNPVKPHWCITGLVGPLGSTNQSWCGVKLLTMSVPAYPVGCVRMCRLLGDSTTVRALMAGRTCLQLAHPCLPTTPPPSTHLPLYMICIILQEL